MLCKPLQGLFSFKIWGSWGDSNSLPFDYLSKRIYGKIVKGRPSINKERAACVTKWVQWILEEGIGLAAICYRMNQDNILSPRASRGWKGTSGKWSPKAIRDILRSMLLFGEFWWKGKLYLKDENLRILTDEQFDKIEKRLDENRERKLL